MCIDDVSQCYHLIFINGCAITLGGFPLGMERRPEAGDVSQPSASKRANTQHPEGASLTTDASASHVHQHRQRRQEGRHNGSEQSSNRPEHHQSQEGRRDAVVTAAVPDAASPSPPQQQHEHQQLQLTPSLTTHCKDHESVEEGRQPAATTLPDVSPQHRVLPHSQPQPQSLSAPPMAPATARLSDSLQAQKKYLEEELRDVMEKISELNQDLLVATVAGKECHLRSLRRKKGTAEKTITRLKAQLASLDEEAGPGDTAKAELEAKLKDANEGMQLLLEDISDTRQSINRISNQEARLDLERHENNIKVNLKELRKKAEDIQQKLAELQPLASGQLIAPPPPPLFFFFFVCVCVCVCVSFWLSPFTLTHNLHS